MKLNRLFIGLLAVMTVASCANKEDLGYNPDLKTLSVKVEQKAATKVGFTDGTAEFFWTAGDQIGVNTATTKRFFPMDLNSAAGEATGTFTANMSSDPAGYAVYPYGANWKLVGTTLTYTMPSSYNYDTVDSEYANPNGKSHNAVMWGAIENNAVFFKHLGGVIAFELNQLPAGTSGITLTVKSEIGRTLSGVFDLDLTQEFPVMANTDAVNGEGSTVTVTFNTQDAQTKAYVYLPVPTGLIGNMEVTIAYGSEAYTSYYDDVVINRGDIKRAKLFFGKKELVAGGENGVKEVESVEQVKDALTESQSGGDITVKINNVEGDNNEIVLPSSLSTETTTFAFDNVENNTEINVSNESGASYDGQVIFEIPEGVTGVTINADVPNGEVYIKQGNVTTLVASSAQNTTIIGAGATVENLIVAKGNVKIELNGSVTNISRTEDNPDDFTFVYCAEGTQVSNANPQKIRLIHDIAKWDGVAYAEPKQDGDTYVISNPYELAWVANQVNTGKDYFAGKTILLTQNIDLNNKEWTPIGSAVKDHGFMGNFNGNGFVIGNLKMTTLPVDSDNYVYAGLFGVTEGTDANNQNNIKNLTIENVTISSKGHIVAAAIAYPYYTNVENITVKGKVDITGGDYTAGVLAYTRRCVDAKDLYIVGNSGSSINGRTTVGGVISDIQMNGGLTANYSNFNASGLTIKADQNVGGISGIISLQTLNGARVENVTIDCANVTRGKVSGALGGKSIITQISVSGVKGANNIVGATYQTGFAVVNNGDTYETDETVRVVSNADELVDALEKKKNVIFANDVKIDPANMSNAYGKTGINVKYGQIIDGNGYTLNIKGAGGTWDSGINTTGGIIKDLKITGSFRGIFVNHNSTHSEKVVLENVILEDVTYTISCDQGLKQGLEARNCTFKGWTSFAATLGEATFVNCNFEEGRNYKFCRPYAAANFIGCNFCEGYEIDARASVTFNECKQNNQDLTMANLSTLVTSNINNVVEFNGEAVSF